LHHALEDECHVCSYVSCLDAEAGDLRDRRERECRTAGVTIAR
jgi:hypothetical protein